MLVFINDMMIEWDVYGFCLVAVCDCLDVWIQDLIDD